jgi:hypothetical protein
MQKVEDFTDKDRSQDNNDLGGENLPGRGRRRVHVKIGIKGVMQLHDLMVPT